MIPLASSNVSIAPQPSEHPTLESVDPEYNPQDSLTIYYKNMIFQLATDFEQPSIPPPECAICESLAVSPIRAKCDSQLICCKCTKNLNQCPLCENDDCLTTSLGGMRRFVAPFTITCPYCPSILSLLDLSDHLDECIRTVYICGCGATFERHHIQDHYRSECPLRVVPCRYCHRSYHLKDMDEHVDITHTPCPHCHQRHHPKDMAHVAKPCPVAGCPLDVPQCSLMEHVRMKHTEQLLEDNHELRERLMKLRTELTGVSDRLILSEREAASSKRALDDASHQLSMIRPFSSRLLLAGITADVNQQFPGVFRLFGGLDYLAYMSETLSRGWLFKDKHARLLSIQQEAHRLMSGEEEFIAFLQGPDAEGYLTARFLEVSAIKPIVPPQAAIPDPGYSHMPRGWFDATGQGVRHDYGRYVGPGHFGRVVFSLAMAGAASQYDDGSVTFESLLEMPSNSSVDQRHISDLGYASMLRGWFDVSGTGIRDDYCRYVGDAADPWFRSHPRNEGPGELKEEEVFSCGGPAYSNTVNIPEEYK